MRINLAVKQIENLAETGLRKLEQTQMPSQVAPKEVVVIKKSPRIAEQFDALSGTTLHLKHMGQGMQGPKILRLHSQRLARATLGHYVLANLFHREGMSRQKMRITGRLGAPMTGYSRAHFGLMSFVTRPKKRTCVLTQSQQIQWPLDQDLLPGGRTSRKILRNPGTQGFLVQMLPGFARQSLRLQQMCPCLRVSVERTFGHKRVALEYMSKDKLRKLLQQCV